MQMGVNLPRVEEYNRAVVLDTVRRRSPVSRAELAQVTGLTNQTVSNVARRLLEAGLIRESGQAPSRGGKPPRLLKLCSDGAFAVGVHLDSEPTIAVLLDLSGRVLRQSRMRIVAGSDPDRLVRPFGRAVDGLVTRAGVAREKIVGLGVAVPGPIDTRRGVVLDPPDASPWCRVPLIDILDRATQLPVVMDNDATAAAIGEQWAGGADREGSFLFVYMGTGIGGGVMFADGALRGYSGNAGEFGHVLVVPGGKLCRCGARGCLEAYAAPHAVLADFADLYGRSAAEDLCLCLDPARTRADWGRRAWPRRRATPARPVRWKRPPGIWGRRH
jgi:predicted NBD/HSP70 family sugar kinase